MRQAAGATARIERLRVALIAAPLATPIVAPFGTVSTRHNLLVRVETHDGAWGVGEVWGNFPPWGCRDRVEILRNVLRPLVVGQTLDDPVRIFRSTAAKLRPLANQLGAIGPFQQALAGVDIALWDACARRRNQPLCDFIRAAPAPRSVAVYATNLPIERPASIEEMASKGHNRFKFRIPAEGKLMMGALKEARAIAGRRALMADATQSFSLERLRALARPLADLALDWLEEPFLADDLASYQAWRNEPSRPPVALGENTYGVDGFQRLLTDIAPDVLQPDITKTAGISAGADICRLIMGAGKRACLHMYGGPVGLYASAHLSAAIDGVSWLEMDAMPNPLFELLLNEEPTVRNGQLYLPNGAGLGEDLLRPGAFDAAEVH
jgi:D-galactarolactone cycloisomerase